MCLFHLQALHNITWSYMVLYFFHDIICTYIPFTLLVLSSNSSRHNKLGLQLYPLISSHFKLKLYAKQMQISLACWQNNKEFINRIFAAIDCKCCQKLYSNLPQMPKMTTILSGIMWTVLISDQNSYRVRPYLWRKSEGSNSKKLS